MHIAPSHLSRALKSIFAAVFAFFALIAVSTPVTHAAPGVRANVTYQARLMDASGYPVADGVYQVEFSLYDAPVAGNRLWTADGTVGAPLPVNVTVQDGLFTVLLGDGVTQLPFGEIDWNSDSLYLGVTIGADGEMSPRRPITAVPQAINSAQLSGMSPSSTDTYGGESQFTILQASTTAATSTRSALDVRSNGTSVANDFIFRAISSTGLPLFTINSQGTVSTTDLLVDGIAVCRADGTDCLPVASGTSTLQEVYEEGNAITLNNNALELTVIASGTNLLPFFGVEGYASFVAKGFGEGGLTLVHASSSFVPTTTYMFFTSDVNDPINATSSYIASQPQVGILQIAAANELGLSAENQGNLSLQTIGGNIIFTSATTTMQSNFIITGEVASDINPFLDDTYSLGTSLSRWQGYFSGVTTTFLSVAGQSVCLEDGTNCPVAGASTLQDAYDNGNTIVTADGAIQLVAASTTLVGADLYSHLITGTFASGTNEGIDFSLFANSSNPYLSGTGTSFIYREDRTLQPGLTTSSGIGFSNDNTENFLTLFTVRPSGPSQNITFNNDGITYYPGAGATSTFAQNVALEATARVDSDLLPRYDGVFALGNDTNRWDGSFNYVTSSYQHLQSAAIPLSAFSGAMLINNELQGVAAGLDIVTIATSTPVQLDNIAFHYRQDRTVQDQYAELVMGQTATDGFHRLLLEVKEGAEENDIEMTPTSTWASGDLIPKNDNTYSLGLANYRWNADFFSATATNLVVASSLTVGGQSVCLQNGTNCPVSGSATLQTAYDGTGIGEGRIIDVEGGAFTLQGYASGTNVLSGFPGYEGYNHFEILHASNSQEGIAFGSWRAAGFATGTYMSFASNMSDLSDSGTAFRWDQSGTFAIEQTTTTGGISLIMNDLGFDFNGTTTYSDQSFFNDTVNVAGSILVGGVNVCLQNGTNCPAGGGDLQDAYDAGRFITLDDGRIDLTAAFGTPDDFTFSVRGSPIDHTKVFGAGSAYDANVGFDISMTQDGNTTGTLFTFTNNRANPESSLSSAYLSHEVFDTGSGLTLGNATVTFGLSEDSINGSNEFGQFGFYRYFQIEADPLGGDPALNIINNGAGATSIIRFDNTLVQNDLHLIDDQDPNGVVTPVASGDLLIRNQSTGGPESHLYINIDGTNTGWVGVATEESLANQNLQQAYNLGTDIEAYFGPTTYSVSSTSPDYVAFPWLDMYKTIVSEGYNNDGISLMHASGTLDNQHFVHFGSDVAGNPFALGSSWLMGDTGTGNVELYADTDLYLQAPADEIFLQAVTSTFQSNLVMDGTFVGSNLTPLFTNSYSLGTSSRRWNEVHANGVSATVMELVTGTLGHDYSVGPISARALVETSHVLGGVEGFDIANVTLGGNATGTALFTIANRNNGAPFSATGLSGVTSTGIYGYHSPTEGSDLFVFSQANNKNTFIRMTDNDISIRAGGGVSSTGGLVEFKGVSTTAAGATFRNATSSPTNQNWDVYARHAAFGERYADNSYATGTDVYGMYVGFAGASGVICLDDVNTAATCPTAPSASIVSEGAINAFDFDLAEMYESADQLEPGDIIVASTANDMQVVRSSNTTTLPMGIVSTKPGLLLGRQKNGAHPIALAGRVPTKVSTINGEIKTGDLLAPTSIPGVAGKAIEDGPIVGIALQSYNGADVGKIEVFVKTSWYSKPNNIDQVVENNTYITNVVASEPDVVRRGLAKIETGAVKVRITFETLNGYPFVQTTPRGLIVGAWSTDNYTDTGFDIILEQPQTFDVVFGWEARALDGSTMMIMSDGTSLLVDPTSGQVVVQEPEPIEEEPSTPSEPPAPTPVGETEPDPVPEPAPEPEPTPEPAPEPAPSPEPSNP